MPAQVTATGIRDGDPAVLHALVHRRGSAVLAYCERACAPSVALDAAAEAFARFRESVLASDRPTALDPETSLLSAVRRAAAERAPRPDAESTGLGRLLGGRSTGATLARVPELVAAREEGMLTREDEETLDRLLDASPVARAIEERFAAAEEAYRTAPRQPLSPPVAEQLVVTMAALQTSGNGAPAPEAPVEEVTFEPLVAAPEADAVEEATVTETETETDTVPEDAVEEPAAPEPEEEPEEPAEEAVAPAPDEPEDAGVAEPVENSPEEMEEQTHVEAPPPEVEEDVVLEDDTELEDDPVHVQSASGAVDEALEEEQAAEDDQFLDGEPAAAEEQPARSDGGWLAHLAAHRPHMPSRAALAPAGAVVVIAAIGAMAASGVFGGNDPSPPVDTGIVPPRALLAVPEGEAASVVDDLRSSAEDARRRRLADQRSQIVTEQQSQSLPPAGDTTAGADDAPASGSGSSAEPSSPDDAGNAADEPTDSSAADTEDTPSGDGGTPAEESEGGGTASP